MAKVIKLNARDAVRKWQKIGEDIAHELFRAEEENLRDALRTAQDLSQGEISPRELKRFHPYARNPDNRKLFSDPAIINIHDEGFLENWETEGPLLQGSTLTSTLGNSSPEAEFILNPGGTAYMVERPILKRVVARIASRVGRRRREAFGHVVQKS